MYSGKIAVPPGWWRVQIKNKFKIAANIFLVKKLE
jgi:hypothetical protein